MPTPRAKPRVCGAGPLPTVAGRGDPIRVIDKPSLLHNRQAPSKRRCQNSPPGSCCSLSFFSLHDSLSSSVHTHTHTLSTLHLLSLSPPILLFYAFMEVKPVIPIRMKTLQMKGTATAVLVPVMVEWLMECVCLRACVCARAILASLF